MLLMGLQPQNTQDPRASDSNNAIEPVHARRDAVRDERQRARRCGLRPLTPQRYGVTFVSMVPVAS